MSGLAGLQAAAAEQEARKAAFKENAGPYARFAKFEPNQTYTVRFLEQGDEVQWCWVHDLPPEAGKKYGGVTPCLKGDGNGQACPGCEMNVKRKIAGWINLIIRDAPKFERDADGRLVKNPMTQKPNVVGVEDAVFVWNSGSRLFTTLANKDKAFRGLMSRDFMVIRTGEGLGTQYAIEPADADSGPQPMSEQDLELAANKYDTRLFTQPESYEAAKQLLQGVPRSAIQEHQANAQAASANIFNQAFERISG